MSTDVYVAFRIPDTVELSADVQLDSLKPLIDYLASRDRLLSEWLLKGDSLKEALLHSVFAPGFDGDEAARAVLRNEEKKKRRKPFFVSSISLWNGEQDSGLGASIHLMYSDAPAPDHMELSLDNPKGQNRLGDWKDMAGLVALCVRQWSPLYAHVFDMTRYGPKAVFQDRLAVGWMLYLPRALTQQQVPEAHALLPMPDRDGKPGTLIVSTTDTFDVDNAEHIKNANAIEVRLADQGLLPSILEVS